MANTDFSTERVSPERVVVKRCNGQTIVGRTTHKLFLAKMANREPVGRGAFIGMGIRDDRGFELYAQMDQISPEGA